jgi:excisionase family DNA binding protein
MLNKLYTIDSLCEELQEYKVSRATIYRLIATKQLKAKKVGRKYFITEASVRECFEEV